MPRLCLLLLLTTAGCAEQTRGTGQSATTPEDQSSVKAKTVNPSASSQPQTPTSESTDEGSGPWLIEWVVALGPSAPGGNHNVPLDAYRSLLAGDCRRVAEIAPYAEEPYNRVLYTGVGNACLAAFAGEPDRWQTAERSLQLLQGQRERTGCYGQTAFDLLEGLVAAHSEDPEREFARTEAEPGPGGCVLVETVQPDHGRLSGGYWVTLSGWNFPPRGLLTIQGATPQRMPPVVRFQSTDGGTRITFTMPSVDEPALGYIIVDGNDEYWNSAAEFAFEAADPSRPSEPQTSTTQRPAEPSSAPPEPSPQSTATAPPSSP